ncbi:MAG: DUF222 domain-containing protein [Mycetocola sp.]
MNTPVSALASVPAASVPAASVPDVPSEEVALDQLGAHLADVIDALDLDHLDRLSGDGVLTVLSKTAALSRGIEAILTAVSNDVAVRSDPARGSAGLAARLNVTQPSHLIEMVAGVSASAALRLMRVGACTSQRATDAGLPLPPLYPVVGDALRQGLVGVEAADVITKELSKAAPRADVDDLVVAERMLVGQATGSETAVGVPLPPDLLSIQARQWRDRLDQDGIEPRAEKAFHDRNFWLSGTVTDGLVRFGGQVTVDVGAKLKALFDATLTPRSAPRYRPTDVEGAGGDAEPDIVADAVADATVEDAGRDAPREERTPGQIRADIFAAMIDSLARSTDVSTVSGASPTVVVRVDAEVLENEKGTGEIIGMPGPVAYSTIAQILCDGSLVPAFIDPGGKLVALGNDQRLFTRIQRLGMIARDGPTCTIDGCEIPATACEAHHIVEYSQGGATHIDNGALFCWFHHRMIDTGVFSVGMVDGRPVVSYPEWLTRKPYFH